VVGLEAECAPQVAEGEPVERGPRGVVEDVGAREVGGGGGAFIARARARRVRAVKRFGDLRVERRHVPAFDLDRRDLRAHRARRHQRDGQQGRRPRE
jgi:hypothetical protein